MSYRVPSRVAQLRDPDSEVLYLACLPDGVPVLLEGPAALIWGAAVGSAAPEGPDEVADLVAEAAGLPVEEIRADVVAFLGQLVEQGLLAVRP